MTRRGCLSYVFAMSALVGFCLLLGAVYLRDALGQHDQQPTTIIAVSDSVQMPTWPPLPNSTETPTPKPTAATWPPPDPGGPVPACWLTGPRPGEPCPPKPTR